MQKKPRKKYRLWIIGLYPPILILVLAGLTTLHGAIFIRWARSDDNAARCALRNALTAQEAYFADYNKYTDSREKLSLDEICPPEEGITVRVVYADDKHYKMEAFHINGEHIFYATEDASKGIYDETGMVY